LSVGAARLAPVERWCARIGASPVWHWMGARWLICRWSMTGHHRWLLMMPVA
jgi:hypothetical protein